MPLQHMRILRFMIIICSVWVFVMLYGLTDLLVQNRSRKLVINTLLSMGNHKTQGNTQNGEFIVNTPTCKIRNLDPYDISITSRLKEGKPPFKCTKYKSLTYQRDDRVYINYTAVNSFGYNKTFKGCYIKPIHRPVHTYSNHNSKAFLPQSELFKTFINIEHEYILVQCLNSSGAVINENFFSFVMKNESVESRCRIRLKERQRKSRDTFSVMIIGLDSVSRLNSMRHLKKTRSFLLNEMQSIEMLGYHKVGDNTFDNMVPLLTGKHPEELPWSIKSRKVFDDYNIIWKNFSEHGYRTLFLEDFPHIAIFDYLNIGFHLNPTDYYNRHFQLMMADRVDLFYNDTNCFIDRTQTEIVMNYTYRFMDTFKNDPYFGLAFITRMTHDVIEQTAAADDIYYNYFKEIHENKLFENTILFFLSDHGLRFGYLRSHFIGKMEERLPMFHVVLPKRFRTKYPTIVQNLYDNSVKLTTHFDVYKTLLDILYLRDDKAMDIRPYPTDSRAYSLFRKIPENRTCANASVEQHWCTCSQLQRVPNNDIHVLDCAQFLIRKINSLLGQVKDLCMPLSLGNIDTAYRFDVGNEELQHVIGRQIMYQLNIRMTPGGALFEGTVIYDESMNNFRLSGDISRINSYGKEKRCAVDRKLEKMCFCRSNLS